MRLRNIPAADEIIASIPLCIKEPANYQGSWHTVFQNDSPIHIEVGMGKGQFLLQLAQQNPDISYIGIEKYTSVLLRAIQKLESYTSPPDNIRFLCIDAESLTEVFAPNEISRIYLNFSDPWPKKRHARRRLTSGDFLSRYEQILAVDGMLEFKTDNKPLFEFSLEEVPNAGWKIIDYTYDLHHDSKMNAGNILTEYEEKFSSKGNPIYKLTASKPQ